jgi:hypothetical protein
MYEAFRLFIYVDIYDDALYVFYMSMADYISLMNRDDAAVEGQACIRHCHRRIVIASGMCFSRFDFDISYASNLYILPFPSGTPSLS